MTDIDPDYDVAIDAYSEVYSAYDKRGFDQLTERERTIFCVWQFVGEVNNGGFRQFLSNPSGEFTSETLEALERIRMPFAASLLKRALMYLPPLAKDHGTRLQQVHSLASEIQVDLLNELTGNFFNSTEYPYALLAEYVREGRS